MKSSRPLPLSLPDGACNEAYTLRSAVRSADRPLAAFSTKELRDELLDRGNTDFSFLQPWIHNSLLIVMFALVALTHWGFKCANGDFSGFVCSIARNL